MDTHEFLALSKELDEELRQDYHQHELYSYVTVWLKSRMPDLYQELEANFRRIEPNVYAVNASFDAISKRQEEAALPRELWEIPIR
tara:strand:+ start:194 stop:451 length:258 start_codon:yes stop_codon:yes gene_type:complete